MAEETDHLKLIKPENGEYTDTWEDPVNDNSQKIDDFAKSTADELEDARGNKTSLGEFLSVGHDEDGNVLPPDEVKDARISTVYGDKKEGGGDFKLKDRVSQGDKEIWRAREQASSLRNNIAAHHIVTPNMIVDGSKTALGRPSWAAYSGSKVTVGGASKDLKLLIEGYFSRVRTDKDVTLSGGQGTYYIYADFKAEGVITVDGDSENGNATSANGTTSNHTDGKPRIFTDSTVSDWTTKDVQPGDVLTLVNSNDAGEYVIEEVGVDGDNAKLKIVGQFPQGGISSIDYTVKDPLSPELDFTDTEGDEDGRIYICEADLDSQDAVTAVRPRHFKNEFVGDWRQVDLTSNADFEEIWDHNLGTDLLDVVVQASQANDGSQPAEELSLSELKNTLSIDDTRAIDNGLSIDNTLLAISNTLQLNSDDGDTLSGDVELSGYPSLGGSIQLTGGVTISGGVVPTNSARAKWSKNKIWVKNVVQSLFYKDYSGVERQTGYVRVLIRKRG